MMIACIRGHTDMARMLIEHGADKDLKDNNGRTALMIACILGHTDTARMLIEHGADKDLKDDSGQTALMIASSTRHMHIKILIEDSIKKISKISKIWNFFTKK